ncbi:sugar phosphate isomerase [Deinococcus malanensis]|uniref:Sugar phosphate isomerase n=1 Tax=Deinococcus malanensis TaxID=1706855 RepID=A0ABQ2EV66_9DEIO|nr:sugar phosphate isomerase/epimerase [Deinococcus malanensis]GGK26337.1 sugar phosphate isomerase [Deinococcus malanensis]
MSHERIALQLYTLRDEVAADMVGVLQHVAGIGYRGVEFAGFGGVPAREVRLVLDSEGLSAVACHVSAAAMREDFEQAAAGVLEVGAPYIVCPWIEPGLVHDAAGWSAFTRELEQWARACAERGLKFAYHNHVFEFEAQHGGQYAFDTLFQDAPGVLVELDAAWAHAGGVSPVGYLRRYAQRTPLLHVKDVALRDGKWVTEELGEGEVDLTGMLAAARETGVEWFIAEQDHCQRDPLESVTANYAWLHRSMRQPEPTP